MKILVTGGSGMVGSYIKKIAPEHHKWVFISSKEFDLTNPYAMDTVIQIHKPDAIIHLAALVGGLFKNMREKVKMFHDNVLINENVLHYANKYNIQYVICCASTCVYPANPPNFPMTEEMIMCGVPHPSNNAYAYAKRMMVMQCQNYNNEFGRKYICVTPCNLYGKYDNFNLDDAHVVPALIHKFYNASKKNEKLVIPTGNDTMRQFVYAKDFAKIILRVLDNIDNMKLNNVIVCNDEVKITDIISQIAKSFPNVDYEIIEKEEGITKKTCSNELLLSTFPDVEFSDFDHKLKKTIDWFIHNYNDVRK